MNLPKQIEERFDEEFKNIFQIDSMTTQAEAIEYKNQIKSFIAKILEEEKECLVGEIERILSLRKKLLEGCSIDVKFDNYYNAILDILSLIKK